MRSSNSCGLSDPEVQSEEVGDIVSLVEDQDHLVRTAWPGASDEVVRGGVERGRGGHL